MEEKRPTKKIVIIGTVSIIFIILVCFLVINHEWISFRYRLWRCRGDDAGETFSNFSNYEKEYSFEVKKDYYKNYLFEYEVKEKPELIWIFFKGYLSPDKLTTKERKKLLEELERNLLECPNSILGREKEYTLIKVMSLATDGVLAIRDIFFSNDEKIYAYIKRRKKHYESHKDPTLRKWGSVYYEWVEKEYTQRYSKITAAARLAKMKDFHIGTWHLVTEDPRQKLDLTLKADGKFIIDFGFTKGHGTYQIEEMKDPNDKQLNLDMHYDNGAVKKCVIQYIAEDTMTIIMGEGTERPEYDSLKASFLQKLKEEKTESGEKE